MRLYMLDTNIVSDLVKRPGGASATRLAAVRDAEACLSAIVVAEIRYGLAKKGSPGLTATVEAVLARLPTLPFDAAASQHYGRMRAALETEGRVIGANDMLIAAHALALGAILVTDNDREFRRVAGLELENWLA